MFNNLTKIEISDQQRLWLKEAVDRFLDRDEVSEIKIKINLFEKVDQDFNPKSIDGNICRITADIIVCSYRGTSEEVE